MKLATLKSTKLDGELVVVSGDLRKMVRVSNIAPTLQSVLDDWTRMRPRLEDRYRQLMAGDEPSAQPFDARLAHSPLPRAYQWCDGSVFSAHMERMAKWIQKPVDARFYEEPFMYQGASDAFLAPTEDIPAVTEDWGVDYESEVAIITDAVPYGTPADKAGGHIALVMICNDVSLRNLIPPELSKGFGFIQSKPASAFSPVAVTPDELGTAWHDYRVHLPLRSQVNGELFGDPDAGQMIFGFDRLIAHAAKTRPLSAGTIVGSGTVANADAKRGTSCITERRVIETLDQGSPLTPFLRFGDRVRIEMLDNDGQSIFGAIEQTVAQARSPG
jgi:fumarylacetoacetate (FAA) hydrolase